MLSLISPICVSSRVRIPRALSFILFLLREEHEGGERSRGRGGKGKPGHMFEPRIFSLSVTFSRQVLLLCLAMFLSRVPFRGFCYCFVLFCFLFYFRKAFRTHMGMIMSAVQGTCLQDGHTFSQVWCVHQGYLGIKKSSSQVEAAKSLLGKVRECNAYSTPCKA